MPDKTVVVDRDIQADRRAAADRLRRKFTRQGTCVINLVSSPGAGKTSLLEATFRHWNGRWNVAVLVGDLATDRDAQRLKRYVPAEQLTTGGACHLEVPLIEKGLAKLPPGPLDFLFIENVGNLVCPASHDLGEHLRVVLISTTEGDDKPGKYPKMFRTSQVMVVTKTDLLPHVPFEMQRVAQDARLIREEMETLDVSAIQDRGIDRWCNLLERQRQSALAGATES